MMEYSPINPDQRYFAHDPIAGTYESLGSISSVASPTEEYDYSVLGAPNMCMPSPFEMPATMYQQSMSPAIGPEDQLRIEFTDLAAPYPEDQSYRPRKQDSKAQPSTSMHMRRRAQNRASQRAFRERKEKHTQDLQRRLSEVEQQYDSLKQEYDKCQLQLQTQQCSSCNGSETWATNSDDGSVATVSSTSASTSESGTSSSRRQSVVYCASPQLGAANIDKVKPKLKVKVTDRELNHNSMSLNQRHSQYC